MDRFIQNVRIALRKLRSSPGFTAAAIITLALGIGANTTIFSAVNTLLLRPLPVHEPDRLAFFNSDGGVTFSYPAYRDFRGRNDVFTGLTAYRVMPMNMSIGNGNNVRSWGYEATGNYFELLGVRPLLGRLLRPDDDDKPGAHPVLVLSYGCWQRRFGGDRSVVGKTLKINGLDYTVLGVAPRGFMGTEVFFSPDLWVPMSMEAQIEPGNDWMERRTTQNIWILGRLKAGVSRRQAEASLNRIAAQLGKEYAATDEGMKVILSAPGLVGNALRKPIVGFATVLMAVAALVLLLACVNLAGMLLARASDRRREIAVRLAIGAPRNHLLAQLLAEALVLASCGGGMGIVLSLWLADLLQSHQLPFDIPFVASLTVDGRVLLFTAGAALLATLLCGLAPAMQSTRADLVAALKNEAVNERLRHWHLRDILVAAQVALCVVLLVSSTLVVRSLDRALDTRIGFNPDHAVAAAVELGLQGYKEPQGRAFQQRVLEKVRALPGIQAAGAINNMPLRIGIDMSGISIEGKPLPAPSKIVAAVIYRATPDYFKAAGSRLLQGRDFDSRDRQGTPRVAVVNETFARKLLAGQNPVGKRFRLGRTAEGVPTEIIGVVEDGKYQSLSEDPTPAVFLSAAQSYDAMITVVARTSRPPDEALRAIRRAISDMDPALPLFNVGSLGEGLGVALFPARIVAIVLGAFGALAAALAATGVFALVAYAVSRRTREIGIRVALGARTNEVLKLVLQRTFALLVIGVALGIGAALAAAPVFSAVLYGVGPRDPEAYVIAVALMAVVTALASLYPARRALRIQPATALRQD